MIATLEPSLLDQWRRRLGGRRRTRRRPWAALGYLVDGPIVEGLVEIEKLTLVVLYDEPLPHGRCALRLAGYSASPIPWGVRFGGSAQCRFLKDLWLQPVPDAKGYRLDLAGEELLALGLQLERELDRCTGFCRQPLREQVRLPKLWAAFQPADAASISGEGPELAAYAQRTSRPPQRLLEYLRRDHLGLALYPAPWVSHHWRQTVAVFADLKQFPCRQVFRLRHLPHDLTGFQDAAEFDFGSGSRRCHHHHRRGIGRRGTATACV
jgi:hypothetical protein